MNEATAIAAVRIRAFAVETEVGRTVDAAEGGLFLRLSVDDCLTVSP